MNKLFTKLLLFIVFIFIFFIAYKYNILSYLNLETLKEKRSLLLALYQENPIKISIIFSLIYIFAIATSLPVGALLSLSGGAIFGSFYGSIIVVFSATIGASLAFLSGRFLFRETLEKKYGHYIKKFNDGLIENELKYIMTLRLVPIIPFFIQNIVSGLTRVSIKSFFIGSILGMAPITIVFVHAGSQLSQINHISEILSKEIAGSLILLATGILAPTLWKKYIKKNKQ